MWYTTYTQGSWGDSRLLVVKNQIGNLTLGPSFGHNLCFNYPNGSCEPILNIYVPRTFQWYKEISIQWVLTPWNCSLKIQESIRTPTPKMGGHLGVWRFIPSHSPALHTPGSMKCDSWASFLASTFISPYLGHESKVRVVTLTLSYHWINIKCDCSLIIKGKYVLNVNGSLVNKWKGKALSGY
jgi:hypothetical protein